MTKNDWEYIVANWASTDDQTMSEIAKIKDADELSQLDMKKRIEDRDKKIQDLTNQNIDLSKTNMSLFLRLTDPALKSEKEEEKKEYTPPSLTDYDRFIKEDGK